MGRVDAADIALIQVLDFADIALQLSPEVGERQFQCCRIHFCVCANNVRFGQHVIDELQRKSVA